MLTQEELDPIFETLKRIMEEYSPPFSVKKPSEALKKKRSFELTSYKRVVIAGRPGKFSAGFDLSVMAQRNSPQAIRPSS